MINPQLRCRDLSDDGVSTFAADDNRALTGVVVIDRGQETDAKHERHASAPCERYMEGCVHKQIASYQADNAGTVEANDRLRCSEHC
jgi:hypothetical protein